VSEVIDLLSIGNVITHLQIKEFIGVRDGLLEGQAIGPHLPTH
jgi:hypothetical protein